MQVLQVDPHHKERFYLIDLHQDSHQQREEEFGRCHLLPHPLLLQVPIHIQASSTQLIKEVRHPQLVHLQWLDLQKDLQTSLVRWMHLVLHKEFVHFHFLELIRSSIAQILLKSCWCCPLIYHRITRFRLIAEDVVCNLLPFSVEFHIKEHFLFFTFHQWFLTFSWFQVGMNLIQELIFIKT